MRKQTLVSSLTSRIIFLELALGWMTLLTKRFSARTFQMIYARLSKNEPMVTFCLGYFSSSTHFDLVMWLAQTLWRQCVRVFAHDLGFRGGNCNGLLANTGLFLSTGNRYLFFHERRLILFDSLSQLLLRFSHASRQTFVIEVFDLFFSSPWFSTFDCWEPTSSDECPCRAILIRF